MPSCEDLNCFMSPIADSCFVGKSVFLSGFGGLSDFGKELVPEMKVTLRPKNGVRVQVEKQMRVTPQETEFVIESA